MPPELMEWGGLGLNGASVLILYAMHRDIREANKRQEYTWEWVRRIRRHLWPDVFKGAGNDSTGSETPSA